MNNYNKGKWTMKDGKEILIKDMTTNHICNCIKAIKEGRIQVGQTIFIGYTGDGDGDGQIYDFIDYSEDYIKMFQEELKKRKKEE